MNTSSKIISNNKSLVLPNYDRCLTNLACSIQKYFDLKPLHNTLSNLDDILDKTKPKNVIVLLYDGMGLNLLKRHLPKKSFLIENIHSEITSVLPPTTTAATTSITTGLNPVEHGWLGWDLYFKSEEKIVTMYFNTLKGTYDKAAEYNIPEKHLPFTTIVEQINNESKHMAKEIFPFGDDAYVDLEDLNSKIIDECGNNGKKYIYAYVKEPDKSMHELGTNTSEIKNLFLKLNENTEKLASQLKDTLLIVTADHGMLDTSDVLLTDYPDLLDTLDGDIWIESRCCAFKVKEGQHKVFEDLFEKYFGNDFILKSKEEVISEQLFGDGKENKMFSDSLGDYLALAVGNRHIEFEESNLNLRAMHAGFTEDEMIVPLILVKK